MSVRRLEVFVSGVLRMGVALSGTLILAGMALLLSSGDTSCPLGSPSIEWLMLGDPFLQPSHVMFVGFLVLVSTPVIRVAVSVAAFALERDWLYVIITCSVLTVLVAGMFLGLG